ncbi:MAG: hypothetical protein WAM30_06105 [Candidatus Dormiibacterota bacterium]
MPHRGSGRTAELTLRIERVEDLFRAPEPHLFQRTQRIASGIDDLLLQLDVGRIPKRVRTTFRLAPAAPPLDEVELERTLRQYCALRLRDVALRLRAHNRQGLALLPLGTLLFLIGVALSAEFLSSFWPTPIQDLFGDGVFLVIAWVGLWYPLDHLLFGRHAIVRERNLLRAVEAMEIALYREASEGEAAGGA